MFTWNDKEISTKITISTARKLKEREIIDLLDPSAYADTISTLSNPLQVLDLLWEIVKPQFGDLSQSDFEEGLEDIQPAVKSVEADVENFIHALGAASTDRWQGLLSHAKRAREKETETLTKFLDSPKVEQHLQRATEEALSQFGTDLKS